MKEGAGMKKGIERWVLEERALEEGAVAGDGEYDVVPGVVVVDGDGFGTEDSVDDMGTCQWAEDKKKKAEDKKKQEAKKEE